MHRVIIAATVAVCLVQPAFAYHEGHEGVPPAISAWFARQKMPDSNTVYPTSCCGDYDAYEADEFEVKDGQYIAIITTGKNDLLAGTRVVIPPNKMPLDNHDPNPSGHGIVFLSISRDTDGTVHPDRVYCYFPPASG
jgi:hypothetical protein